MPIDIPSDHDEHAVSTHEAGALVQSEAREEAHAPAIHVANAVGGPDGDIDDVPSNCEEMP